MSVVSAITDAPPRRRRRSQELIAAPPSPPVKRVVRDIPVAAIQLTPHNPRTEGDSDLDGLTASLAAGLAQMPTVEELAPDVYRVLLGERRVRAATEAGWETIPCVVVPPQDAIHAHRLRLVENLNRRDLRPVDEARGFRLDWLCANAEAMGLRDAALAVMAAGVSPPARLAMLTELLEQNGFVASRPAVTQEATLTMFGLSMNKERLKKLLRVLAVDIELQQQAQDTGLSEAALRALGKLDVADQHRLLESVIAEPGLAKKVRSIVEAVRSKGRTLDHAIAIAQGRVGAVGPDADDRDREGEASDGAATTAPDHPSPAPVEESGHGKAKRRGPDPALVGEKVDELVKAAQQLYSVIDELVAALDDRGVRGLPPPFDELALEAADLVDLAIQRIR